MKRFTLTCIFLFCSNRARKTRFTHETSLNQLWRITSIKQLFLKLCRLVYIFNVYKAFKSVTAAELDVFVRSNYISKIITGDSLFLRSKILVDLEEQNTLILWIKIRRRYVCTRFFCSFFGSAGHLLRDLTEVNT